MKRFVSKTDIAFYCLIIGASLVPEFYSIGNYEKYFVNFLWLAVISSFLFLLFNEMKIKKVFNHKVLSAFLVMASIFIAAGISTLQFEMLGHKALISALLGCLTILSYRISIPLLASSPKEALVASGQISLKNNSKVAA